jgi:phage virion morphogenesis protein
MAGAGFTCNADVAEVLKKLREMRARLGNMSPAWASAGEVLIRSVRVNFDASGRPTAWPPLKASTLSSWVGTYTKVRKKHGGLTAKGKRLVAGRKILIRSGALLNSITKDVGRDHVEVGSNLLYAATHQYGRTSGRGAPIPARPYLAVQPEDEPHIAHALEQYLMEGIR